MLSLAPLRYSTILQRRGGPLEHLEYGAIAIHGKRFHQANARLSRHLNLGKRENQLFSDADGTGTHRSPMVARHMAISEALERWAFHYLTREDKPARHGFREDDTTSGMAAFPGLFRGAARKLARLEAQERYCIVHWWNGWLGHQPLPVPIAGIGALRIQNPLSGAAVVLCWRTGPGGWTGYGAGAATRRKTALWKAIIEMERAVVALEKFKQLNPSFSNEDLPALQNYLERRLLYYALPAGHANFLERVDKQLDAGEDGRPEPIVDTAIPGPWEKYATVWRTLYRTHTREHLNPRRMTFFW